MKIIKSILSILLTLCLLTFNNNLTVDAASISSSGSSQLSVGQTTTITFKLTGVTATGGSATISVSGGLEIVSKKFVLGSAKIASFDGNNGAFAYSSSMSISGNYVEVTVKATSIGNQSVSISSSFKNGNADAGSASNTKNIKVICASGNHSWGKTTTKDPTCTSSGSTSKTCTKCGYTYTTSLDALGHNVESWQVTLEPTCTEKGTRSGVCTRCNETITEEIDALGHEFGADVVIQKANCITEGITEHECVRCGYLEQTNTGLGGHEIDGEYTVVKEATVYMHGVISGICKYCGQEVELNTPCEYTDETSGITFSCVEGTFKSGTTIEVKTLDLEDEETSKKYKELLGDLASNYLLFNFDATVGGVAVEPNNSIDIEVNIPEGFSDKVVVAYIDEETGNIEFKNTIVEDGVVKATIDHFSLYGILDLTKVQEDYSMWIYMTIGASFIGIILVIILMVVVVKEGKKKDEEPISEQAKDTFMGGDNVLEVDEPKNAVTPILEIKDPIDSQPLKPEDNSNPEDSSKSNNDLSKFEDDVQSAIDDVYKEIKHDIQDEPFEETVIFDKPSKEEDEEDTNEITKVFGIDPDSSKYENDDTLEETIENDSESENESEDDDNYLD